MKFKLLGKSGLKVSELCLGTMTFGEEWGWGASREESRRIYDRYLEAGGNFIDTANRYTEGTSEQFLGEFIGGDREKIVLATKYTSYMRLGDPNSAGNSRKNMVQSLEASLKRLATDYIDLYLVHAWDYLTPVDEVMRALDDMIRAGKVLYIGISDTPAWIVSQANTLAELKDWSQFVALQIEYSLIERTVERELLPMARALGLTVTPWGILGGGVLTGKYSKPNDEPKRMPADSPRISERNLAIAGEIGKISEDTGYSRSQVAISWVRQKYHNILPILGARTVDQLEDNLASLDISLNDKQMDRLISISAVPLGFPHEFLGSDMIKRIVYADTYDQISSHRKPRA
jgi:aryl-alcohol dehydrogenase-like predicted oxidoreductase